MGTYSADAYLVSSLNYRHLLLTASTLPRHSVPSYPCGNNSILHIVSSPPDRAPRSPQGYPKYKLRWMPGHDVSYAVPHA